MRTALTAIIVLVFGLSAFVFAQTGDDAPSPKSIPAKRALQKHQQAMKAADQAWQKAATEASRTLIRELESAKATAMKSGSLEEANAIQAAIDSAKEELDRLEGKPVVQTLDVVAGDGWVDVSQVKAGQRIKITASGTWCANTTNREKWTFGPEGAVIDGIQYGLMAQVGGREIYIGRGRVIAAPEDGMLRLRLFGGSVQNDDGQVIVNVGSP